MRLRAVASVGAVLLGACAHQQVPMADVGTTERWERIMRQMRADSAETAAASAISSDRTTSETVDATIAPGIDISKFELPIHYNERVQEYLDLYARRRSSVFSTWLRRMGRYRPYIEERLAAQGMPRELVYLPLIESGYETTVKSRASAVGLWQFMSGTARSEGLEVSDYVDERRDPFRSTDAALRHLAGLHRTFGSWYLAAAAYNSGSGRVARLLKEHGRTRGPDELFWEVQGELPQETRDYVPGLIAAAIIGEYPHLFGLDGVVPDAPVRYETVSVPGATELRAVARASHTSVDDIQALNPHYHRGITPPNRHAEVRVPIGASADFQTALARIPAEERTRRLARTHVVRQGETLSGIAARYGTTVAALQKANRITRPHVVSIGRKLTIPSSGRTGGVGTD